MNSSNSKKSPILLFFAAFVLVVIVMFVANQRSALVDEMRLPFNQGMRELSTYGNSLMAVSSDNKIFVWDWAKLSEKPRTGSVESQQAVLLEGDLVASLRVAGSTALVLTDIKGDETHKEIPLGLGGGSKAYLCANSSRDVLAVILADEENEATGPGYQFVTIDLDVGRALKVLDITGRRGGLQLTDFAVSDDGRFIAGAGEKDHRAWLVLVDIKQRRMLWDKTYDNPNRFGSVIFSFDSKTIFAGGGDGAVYWFRVSDGKLVDHFRFKGKAKIPHETISIRHMTISPDSSLLAYIYGFNMYVFDCKTKKEIHSQRPGHKAPGALAFSPDSSLIATCDLRQGGKIKIWPRPSE
jgi:WD40 repeat protein